MLYICKICNQEFDNIESLSKHSRKYKKSSEEIYIDYVLNNIEPTCACGCGEKPNYIGINKGFRDYIRGHASRVKNNWGHNPEAIKKSHNTQRKLYQEGKLTIWNKGLTKEDDPRLDYGEKISSNKERSKKISESLMGRKRSQAVLDKLDAGMRKYWSSEENKEKQSHNRVTHIKEHRNIPTSILENRFEDMLSGVGGEYYRQFYVRDTKSLYDFKIKGKNILIEIDGDFWHCNPNTHPIPKYDSQKNNLRKDLIKNQWCADNGYTLLRFWETDINERPEWVMSELSKHL